MYYHKYEEELMQYTDYRVHKWLLLYVPPILLFVGTFGNLFSFIILRQNMRKLSTYFYLAILAIMDILVLYVGLLRLWAGQLTNVDIRNEANWLCKSIIFLGYVTSDSSVWLIIAVTVERYIAVCYPLKAPSMCNVRRGRFVIAFLILAICCINGHFFWTVQLAYTVHEDIEIVKCEEGPDHVFLVTEVWPWVDAALYSFLPFVLITILNCLIIRRVINARKNREHLQNVEKISKKGDARKRQNGEGNTKLTCMLLTVSFSFLITTLPMNGALIATAFWNMKQHEPHEVASFQLGKTITELLMYVNHTINFFLYCATGKKFRKQIIQLVCRRKNHRRTISERTRQTTLGASRIHNSPKNMCIDNDEFQKPKGTQL